MSNLPASDEAICRCNHAFSDHVPARPFPCVCWRCSGFEEWPNCRTPDCGNKQCDWSGTVYCCPCATTLLGPEEMIQRFNETHDKPWPDGLSMPAPEGTIR